MEISNLQTIIANAVMLGLIQYRNSLNPSSDRMKQREVWRYLERLGYKRSILNNWVEMGIVRKRKDGDGNTSVYYSFAEIQSAVLTAKVMENNV